LKIPVGDGQKLFFISKGKIILKKYYPILAQTKIDTFLAEGRKLRSGIVPDWDEKANVDFQNILFSEIESLSDE